MQPYALIRKNNNRNERFPWHKHIPSSGCQRRRVWQRRQALSMTQCNSSAWYCKWSISSCIITANVGECGRAIESTSTVQCFLEMTMWFTALAYVCTYVCISYWSWHKELTNRRVVIIIKNMQYWFWILINFTLNNAVVDYNHNDTVGFNHIMIITVM